MAAYTPATLISTKALGNGAGNISTWRYQNTAGASAYGIVRVCTIETVTAARTFTLQQGATAADTAAQRIADAVALTANVPYLFPAQWIVVVNNDYFQGFANNTDIQGAQPRLHVRVNHDHLVLRPIKRGVVEFVCPTCNNRMRTDGSGLEPACTGPTWRDDHPLTPMVQVRIDMERTR